MNEAADIVVIGGGIIGVTIAFCAAQRQVGKIILLETATLASASTGLSTGVVRQFYMLPELVRMGREGLAWYGHFRDIVDGEDAGFVNCGLLVGGTAAQRPRFVRGIQLQSPTGSTSCILDRGQLCALYPHMIFSDLDCAYYEPEAGYADPSRACFALASAARLRGVSIRQSTPAIGLKIDRKGISGVVTRNGEIATRVVVLAAGPWSKGIAAWAGVTMTIRPTRHKIIVVERPPTLSSRHPIFADAVNLFYMRPESMAQLLIGSTDPADSRDEVNPDTYARNASFDEIADLSDRAVRRVFALRDVGLVTNWCGIYDESQDGFPLLGEAPEVSGLYVAAGFSGHGFKLAPAVGRMMVSAILDRAVEPAMHMLRLSRFSEGEAIDSPTTTTLTSMKAA